MVTLSHEHQHWIYWTKPNTYREREQKKTTAQIDRLEALKIANKLIFASLEVPRSIRFHKSVYIKN